MTEQKKTADDIARRIRRAIGLERAAPVFTGTSGAGTGTETRPDVGFKNPMTAPGDLIQGGTSGAATRLGIGADGEVLTVVAGKASWEPATGGAATGQYRSPVYIRYAGGDFVFTGAGDLVYTLEELE
ncbi:MAG TPA: hypothetical protein VH475_26505 [Tepidisphaeraceae bacterium]|jgi:hypothetical protein